MRLRILHAKQPYAAICGLPMKFYLRLKSGLTEKFGLRPFIFGLLASLVLIFVTYLPLFEADFVNWDDPLYVYENADIMGQLDSRWKNLALNGYVGNYHPITMLSLAMDQMFWGADATGFHLTNLLLHLANTFLVGCFIFLLLKPLNVKGFAVIALLTALLFGIHPMQVESVAWVAERKNVLYVLFYLLALIAYLNFTKHKGSVWTTKLSLYLLVLVFSLLSMLSKGQGVTLPIAFLLIDALRQRNIRQAGLWLEKIPFFAFSLVIGLVTLWYQEENLNLVDQFNFIEKIILANASFWIYTLKLIFPFKQTVFYTYPEQIYGWHYGLLCLTFLTLFWLWKKQKRNTVFLFGLSFYVLQLLLVIQILSVGQAVMAERYIYLSCVGLFLVFAFELDKLRQTTKHNALWINGIVVIYVMTLSVLNYERVKVWENSQTMWEDTLEKNETLSFGWFNLGHYFQFERNQTQKAKLYYAKALNKDSEIMHKAYCNLGIIFSEQGQNQKALQYLDLAIKSKPDYARAYYNRGNLRVNMAQYQAALSDYDHALSLNNALFMAYSNRGSAHELLADLPSALQDYNKSLETNPYNSPSKAFAYFKKARILLKTEQLALAQEAISSGLKILPGEPSALQLKRRIEAAIKRQNSSTLK